MRRRAISNIVAGMVFVLVTAAGTSSQAGRFTSKDWGPRNGITLGPSVGWITGDPVENGVSTGIDLSYFHRITLPLFFWVSGGARVWIDKPNLPVLPYVETGLSILILSVGAGWNMGLNSGNNPWHGINMFVGLNAPIGSPAKGHSFYVTPYYRPTWDVSSDDGTVTHEIGALVKWCFGSVK